MRKSILCIFVLSMFMIGGLVTFTTPVSAADAFTTIDGWEWHYNDTDPSVLTSVVQVGGSTEINIPAELVPGVPLTKIGDNCFYNADGKKITKVISIPDTVTSIGICAFRGCSYLTFITIPNSITSVGWGIFYECISLTTVNLPNNITSIPNLAFGTCASLKSITIPNSVTSIGAQVFASCNKLTEINFLMQTPPSLGTNWKMYVPDTCRGHALEFSSFPSPGESLNGLIMGDYYVPDYTIVEGTTAYVELYGWQWYFDTTAPNTLKRVVNVGGSTEINIPSMLVKDTSLTVIGDSCFYDAEGKKITKVLSMPDTIISINYNAFRSCTSLTNIIIGDGVTNIGSYAFNACTSLISITIPNNVMSISDGAFSGCSSLKSVTIGNSVKTIENSVFGNCIILENINFLMNTPPTVGYGWIYNTPTTIRGHTLESSSFPAPGESFNGLTMGEYLQITYIWDGEGTTNLASDAANWRQDIGGTITNDVLPINNTHIRFNITSIKNCTWDLTYPGFVAKSFSILTGYTGTITQGDIDMGFGTGGYYQLDGTFTGKTSKNIYNNGNLIKGFYATITSSTTNWIMISDTAYIDSDNSFYLLNLQIVGNITIKNPNISSKTLEVNGKLTLESNLQINNNGFYNFVNTGTIEGTAKLIFSIGNIDKSHLFGDIRCPVELYFYTSHTFKLIELTNIEQLTLSGLPSASGILNLNGYSLTANNIYVGSKTSIINTGVSTNIITNTFTLTGTTTSVSGPITLECESFFISNGIFTQGGDIHTNNLTQSGGTLTGTTETSIYLGSTLTKTGGTSSGVNLVVDTATIDGSIWLKTLTVNEQLTITQKVTSNNIINYGMINLPVSTTLVYPTYNNGVCTNNGQITGDGTLEITAFTNNPFIDIKNIDCNIKFEIGGTTTTNSTISLSSDFTTTKSVILTHISNCTLTLNLNGYTLSANTITIDMGSVISGTGIINGNVQIPIGTLTHTSSLVVNGNVLVNGGTLTGTEYQLTINGVLTYTAGAATQSTGEWHLGGFVLNGAITFKHGKADIYIGVDGFYLQKGKFSPHYYKNIICAGSIIQESQGNIINNGIKLIMTGNSTLKLTDTLNKLLRISGNVEILSTCTFTELIIDESSILTVMSDAILTVGNPVAVPSYTNNGIITGDGTLRFAITYNLIISFGYVECDMIIRSVTSTNQQVKLTEDSIISSLVINSLYTTNAITLDLNGHNLTTTSITIDSRGILTNTGVVATVTTGAFTLTGTGSAVSGPITMNCYSMTISGGTYTHGKADIYIGTGGYLQTGGAFSPYMYNWIYCYGSFVKTGGTAGANNKINLEMKGTNTILNFPNLILNKLIITNNVTLKSQVSTSDFNIKYDITLDIDKYSLIVYLSSYSRFYENNGKIITTTGGVRFFISESYKTNLIIGNCTAPIEILGNPMSNNVNIKLGSDTIVNTLTVYTYSSSKYTTLDLNGYTLTTNRLTVGTYGIIINTNTITNYGDLNLATGKIDLGGQYIQAGNGLITLGQDKSLYDFTINPGVTATLNSDIIVTNHLNIKGVLDTGFFKVNINSSLMSPITLSGDFLGQIYLNGSYEVLFTPPYSGLVYFNQTTEFIADGRITFTPSNWTSVNIEKLTKGFSPVWSMFADENTTVEVAIPNLKNNVICTIYENNQPITDIKTVDNQLLMTINGSNDTVRYFIQNKITPITSVLEHEIYSWVITSMDEITSISFTSDFPALYCEKLNAYTFKVYTFEPLNNRQVGVYNVNLTLFGAIPYYTNFNLTVINQAPVFIHSPNVHGAIDDEYRFDFRTDEHGYGVTYTLIDVNQIKFKFNEISTQFFGKLNDAGNFSYSIKADDGNGGITYMNVTFPVDVLSWKLPVTIGYWIDQNYIVQFNYTVADDIATEIVAVIWNFDDGTGAYSVAPTHIYKLGGQYCVKVYVVDSAGRVGVGMETFTIGDPNDPNPTTEEKLNIWLIYQKAIALVLIGAIGLVGILGYVFYRHKRGGSNIWIIIIWLLGTLITALVVYTGLGGW